jgi:hypothetical protein
MDKILRDKLIAEHPYNIDYLAVINEEGLVYTM